MCFWEGKTKARELRAQEESVDALSPGSLSVGVRSATQSIMVSMTSVGMPSENGLGARLGFSGRIWSIYGEIRKIL